MPESTPRPELVPSDILAVILARLDSTRFTANAKTIHTTFARAKRHYPLLSAFNFTSSEVYPFSRELEDSFSILQRSRMISRQNPDYAVYELTPTGKQIGVARIEKLDPETQRQIAELAEIFSFECITPYGFDHKLLNPEL